MEFGLIGRSISYSFSKQIHEMLGLYDYDTFTVEPEDFPIFMEQTDMDGLGGINVTIPYKETVMQYLDEVDDLAREIGAVNTVYRRDGKKIGTNTDLAGFLFMLGEAGLTLKGKNAAILGTGGASKMIQYACMREGAASVTVVSRTPEKVAAKKPGVQYVDYDHIPSETEIIINATPVGTSPDLDASPLDLDKVPRCQGVADLIYNPAHTALLLQAEEKGIPCTNGLPMLVAQATLAASFFAPDATEEQTTGRNHEILEALRRKTRNIVLIGMPGSGKSSLGRRLAKELNMYFLDSDDAVEKVVGAPAGVFIDLEGEEGFRWIESQVIAKLAAETGCVIATGGGVVEREENLAHLKQNGFVIYIVRDKDKLATAGRPLSADGLAVSSLYERRAPLYLKWADAQVDNNEEFGKTLAAILRLLK